MLRPDPGGGAALDGVCQIAQEPSHSRRPRCATRRHATPKTLIDLHCHLLPGIDDGPSGLDETIAMARRAYADGVRTVAATPHLRADHPGVHPSELAERAEDVRAALSDAEIPLQVVAGGEVDIFWAGRASDEELRLVSYGGAGRALLIETPYGFLPSVFEDLLADVVGRGFRLVLAHPERNQSMQSSPERIGELVEEGVLIQVNAASLTPQFADEEARRLATDLLRREWVHVLASDSHGPGPWRPPDLHTGYRVVAEQSRDEARWLVEDVPASVLSGTRPPPRPERPASLRSRLGRWRHR